MKNQLQKLAFLLLLTQLPKFLIAQRQYLDATITTNEGVDIKGKLAAENWLTSPRSIRFQPENSEFKTYSVAGLRGFEVTRHDGAKEYFKRYIGKVETSPVRMDRLENSPELHYVQDTVWLRLRYQGAWSLYSLNEPNTKVHYFLETEGQEPQELVFKLWLKENRLMRVELFRKLLNTHATGCPEVQELTYWSNLVSNDQERLSEKALLSIFEAYDRCKDAKPVYTLTHEQSLWKGMALLGWHIGSVNLKPDANLYLGGIRNFHLGFGFGYFLPQSNMRASLYNEILASYDSKKDSIAGIFASAPIGYADYHALHVAWTTMGTLRISKSALSPTLKLGVTNRFQFKQQFIFSDTYFLGNRTRDFSKFRYRYEVGPAIGLSGEYRQIGLDIRYCVTNILEWRALDKNANTRILAISATYRFL